MTFHAHKKNKARSAVVPPAQFFASPTDWNLYHSRSAVTQLYWNDRTYGRLEPQRQRSPTALSQSKPQTGRATLSAHTGGLAGQVAASLELSECFETLITRHHWKNVINGNFPTFSRTCIVFLLTLSLLSDPLSSSLPIFDASFLADGSSCDLGR